MSSINEPNHICKNILCRKKYYACNFCDRSSNWKSVACSKECFDEYQKQVIEARSKGKTPSLLPERTDMTETELKELLEKPIEQVFEETKEELKDYISDEDSTNFSEAVEKINLEIENKKKTTTSKRKVKNVENND